MNASLNNFCGSCHCSKNMFSQQIFHCSSPSSQTKIARSLENIRCCAFCLSLHTRAFVVADKSFTINTTPCNVEIKRKLNLLNSFFLHFRNFDSPRIFPNHTKKSCCCVFVFLALAHVAWMLCARQTTRREKNFRRAKEMERGRWKMGKCEYHI